jgi:Zn-dependent protease
MREPYQYQFVPPEFAPRPPADAAAPLAASAAPADAPVADVLPVPMEQQVLDELEKIRNPKRSWIQAIFLLVLSAAAFIGLGMRDQPIVFTAMLVGIIFLHELGHYVGMLAFGYRNVRMFFIPFFGAAVSGHKTSAEGYQEAIVSLMGPMPGLLLAPVLFGISLLPGLDHQQRKLFFQASFLMGFLNGFNLLPIYPLDGGRLMSQLLFSRNRYLESIFQIFAALALIGLGAIGGGYFMYFLGGCLLITVKSRFQMNAIARHFTGCLGEHLPELNEPIPQPIFRAILLAVQARMPRATSAKAMASFVFGVWEKMHVQPPGVFATLSLLSTYLFGVVLTVPWAAPLLLKILHR